MAHKTPFKFIQTMIPATKILQRVLCKVSLILFLICVLNSCKYDEVILADIESFVEDGLSAILLKNITYSDTGEDLTFIDSSEKTVIELEMINPRSLDAEYTLNSINGNLLNSDAVLDVSDALDNTLYLTANPKLAAEHCDLEFTLDIYVPSTGVEYDSVNIEIPCDTPPSPLVSLEVGAGTIDNIALAAFVLPSSDTDDDLSFFEITWNIVSDDNQSTLTVDVDDEDYKSYGDDSDLETSDGELTRYFSPPDAESGDLYDISIVVIDDSGQSSSSLSGTSGSIVYSPIETSEESEEPEDSGDRTLSYYSNGSLISSEVYCIGDAVSVDSSDPESSILTFAGWDTDSSADTTVYYDVDLGEDALSFTMGSEDVTLYAVWVAGTPIRIRSELEHVSSNMTEDYILTRNISLEDDSWTVLGSSSDVFSGSLNGNNHVLSNLTISASSSSSGLFASVAGSGIIENLIITGAELTTADFDNLGILAGSVSGTISNCDISGKIKYGVGSGGVSNIGGLTGELLSGAVLSDCTVELTSFSSKHSNVGGLVGACIDGTISGCSFTGAITASDSNVGGLAGTAAECTISSCTLSTAVIESSGNNSGGLIGQADSCNVEYCSVSGLFLDISGDYTGGCIGNMTDTSLNTCSVSSNSIISTGDNTGGLVGSSTTGSVTNCTVDLSEGSIEGGDFLGGLIGNASYMEIDKCLVNLTAATMIESAADTGYVGGLIGKLTCNAATYTISESCVYGAGSISSDSDCIGGFIGGLSGTSSSGASSGILTIKECYAEVDITGSPRYMGGFLGYLNDSSAPHLIINYCYYRGTLSASNALYPDSCGLIGCGGPDHEMSFITDSYVFATDGNGDPVGLYYDDNVTTSECYYLSADSISDSAGLNKDESELKNSGILTAWSSSIWGLSSSYNDGFPYLKKLETSY